MGTKRHHDIGFIAIAIFKIVKGLLLFLVGVGAMALINEDAREVVRHWAHVFQLDVHRRLIQHSLMAVGLVKKRNWKLIVLTSFVYSALLLTEGIGLLMEKVWAEFMTIFITASFIPVEVYELARHATQLRGWVLAANVLVVLYLAVRVCQRPPASNSSC
jgi:uncharacterized membrane protein (DUF2068 family)